MTALLVKSKADTRVMDYKIVKGRGCLMFGIAALINMLGACWA